MADEDGQEQERQLAGQQGDGLYPIGRALRATYDADNHDSLGQDLTGLMLELARVEPPPTPAPDAAPASPPPVAARSWFARIVRRLRVSAAQVRQAGSR
ncbi:hypothetical protein [uncultured Sphingomonas sp.]|uniref:hypothetical protein n=1 Tax=uncultured Sphingomonas sp. TaxID=158754 RepID=UPI0035C95875